MIKPASADCNMACDYCYYRHVGGLYGRPKAPRMDVRIVAELCKQYLALEPVEPKFGWQGGEPTLMGLPFFRQALDAQKKAERGSQVFRNTIQTNGVVLNDEWCRFLRDNRFLVGLSVDGPPALNRLRRFANGRPTYDIAMKALDLLKKHAVEFNVLIVISTANVGQPREVFRFLVENELRFAQLIPCTEPDRHGDGLSEHSITAAQYGEFMVAFFDAWVENDDPGYYVRRIDNWLHVFFGLEPEMCEYRGDCSNLVTVEYNGDVYPCDFFVEPRYLMGNVLHVTLEQMLSGKPYREFVRAAQHIPAVCESCEWLFVCHGGCYRHRGKLGLAPDDVPHLCEANKRIFSHVFARLNELLARPVKPRLHAFLNNIRRQVPARSGAQGRESPQDARQAAGRPARRPGRNDPCPCGSGKKFKNCCLRLLQGARGSSGQK